MCIQIYVYIYTRTYTFHVYIVYTIYHRTREKFQYSSMVYTHPTSGFVVQTLYTLCW